MSYDATAAALKLQHAFRELALQQADQLSDAITETIQAVARDAFAAGYAKGRGDQ